MAKLRGTTIIEILVSMSIILICSSMATLIYLNILKGENTAEKLRAYNELKKTQQTCIKEGKYINEEWQEGEFLIKKECRIYQSNKNIIQLKVVVMNEEKKELINQSILVEAN
jgi:type II secretory pathway pseudopilin PulG